MVRGNTCKKEECGGNADQFAFALSLLLIPGKHLLRNHLSLLWGKR